MGNVKCENMFKHVQSNVTITTSGSASNLTANICLLLAIQTLSDLISKRRSFFLVDFKQVFYEIFFV